MFGLHAVVCSWGRACLRDNNSRNSVSNLLMSLSSLSSRGRKSSKVHLDLYQLCSMVPAGRCQQVTGMQTPLQPCLSGLCSRSWDVREAAVVPLDSSIPSASPLQSCFLPAHPPETHSLLQQVDKWQSML